MGKYQVSFGLNSLLNENFNFSQVKKHIQQFSYATKYSCFVELIDKTEYYDVDNILYLVVKNINNKTILTENINLGISPDVWEDGCCFEISDNDWKALNYINIFVPNSVIERINMDDYGYKIATYQFGMDIIKNNIDKFDDEKKILMFLKMAMNNSFLLTITE
jgi:hypothetical protein